MQREMVVDACIPRTFDIAEIKEFKLIHYDEADNETAIWM